MKRDSLARILALAILAALVTAAMVEARSKKKPASSSSDFSYYMLVLSYAPDFCAQPTGNKDPRECGAGRKIGFIVHGLWPQGENSRGPEHCGSSSPVAESIVDAMMNYIPTASLIQHEWSTHGTCSGLSAADYFALIRRARDSVTLPNDLNAPGGALNLSPSTIESKLAQANPHFPPAAFRTSCYRDNQLEELRVCMAKDLSPRACGRSAGECPASSVTLLPVR